MTPKHHAPRRDHRARRVESVARRLAAIGVASIGLEALAFAEARADGPDACAGCLFAAPADPSPVPLVVVLHGDEGSPSKVFAAWKKVAEDAHVALFAPRCPASEGCNGSYWRWDGDPKWLLHQVELVDARHAIDPRRRYLAGWSGGTTYASWHVPSWFPTFAALSLAGGGAPPRTDACLANAGGACAPVHYLQGDANPLYSLARDAHAYLERCGHAVTWELYPGADHAGEWRAYERETGAILAWLLDRREGCSDASRALGAPSTDASSPSPPSAGVPPRPPSGPVSPGGPARSMDSARPAPPPPPRCACSVVDRSDPHGGLVVALAGVVALAARRSRKARPLKPRP